MASWLALYVPFRMISLQWLLLVMSSFEFPHYSLAFFNTETVKRKRFADNNKPYTDLLAFLPPSSKPPNQAGAREGFDDGSLGYYPAISVFRGGAAEANFGPHFWFPPPDLAVEGDTEMANSSEIQINPVTKKQIAGQHSNLRPMSERFNEQIAEDIVYDLVDEGERTPRATYRAG